MAARLRAAGFRRRHRSVLSTGPRKGNLVARLRGTGARKPILLLAHIDVVEAGAKTGSSIRSSCTRSTATSAARGVIDDKAMAAIFVANLIELHQAKGFKPDRDIILALTADEELSHSPHNGAQLAVATTIAR